MFQEDENEDHYNGLWQTWMEWHMLRQFYPSCTWLRWTEKLSGKQCDSFWLLDLLPFYHAMGYYRNLINVQKIVPCSVGLLDGERTITILEA